MTAGLNTQESVQVAIIRELKRRETVDLQLSSLLRMLLRVQPERAPGHLRMETALDHEILDRLLLAGQICLGQNQFVEVCVWLVTYLGRVFTNLGTHSD